MITQTLFSAIFGLFGFLLSSLPQVTTLPWGIDSILVGAMGTFRALMALFPPLQVVFTAFMFYIGFRLLLKLLKMIPMFGKAFD